MIPAQLRIPSPCDADWASMSPRERARHCAQCGLDVMDVSAYRAEEALERLEQRRGSRTCVSYVVRRDGTVRFADSPDVPVSRLRPLRSGYVAVALSLAACGPSAHGDGAGCTPPGAEVQQVGQVPMSTGGDESVGPPTTSGDPSECDRPVDEVRLAGEPAMVPPPEPPPEVRLRGEVVAPDVAR